MHTATYHYNTSSSSESFSLLNYFLPPNQTLDAFCQVTFFHNSLILLCTIFPSMFGLPANCEDSGFHSHNPYPTAFPYGNGMVLHFYQQQESSTTKTVHKVINKGLKTYV